MDKLNQSEFLTERIECPLSEPRLCPALFRLLTRMKKISVMDKSRVLEMMLPGAPLSAILNRLVLLIEAQAPEMLCSVLC